jgi:hypothetical protein
MSQGLKDSRRISHSGGYLNNRRHGVARMVVSDRVRVGSIAGGGAWLLTMMPVLGDGG